MSLSAIPKSLRRRVLDRDQGRCQYCHLSQIGQGAVFHVNHIIPRSKGGATEEAKGEAAAAPAERHPRFVR